MGRIKKNVYENIYYFDFYFLHNNDNTLLHKDVKVYKMDETEYKMLCDNIIKGYIVKDMINYNLKYNIPIYYGTPSKLGTRLFCKIKNKKYIKYRDNKYIKYPIIEDITTYKIKRYKNKKYIDLVRNMPINDYIIRIYEGV